MNKYGYASLLFFALVINEDVIQWALAVMVGGYSVRDGFDDAFEYFTIFGYLFLTAFRLVPYVVLGLMTYILSITGLKRLVMPAYIGGLMGILIVIISLSWLALEPFYTSEHVSSTTAIAFLFIPFYATFAGLVTAVISSGIYSLYLLYGKRPFRKSSAH